MCCDRNLSLALFPFPCSGAFALIPLILIAFTLCLPLPAGAHTSNQPSPNVIPFDIPAGSLDTCLNTMAIQAKITLSFEPGLVADRGSPGLKGRFTTDQALKKLLENTGILYRFISRDTVVLDTDKNSGEPRTKKKAVQSGTETETERSKVYMKIGEVVVTAKSSYVEAADMPSSVDVMGGEQLENENVNFSMELMKKFPGIYSGEYNQGVISGTFSMRGYDLNSTPPVALLIDGIPSYYSSTKQVDMQFIFPLEIEQIDLIRGTSDPRYGLNNISGSMNIHTKQFGNYTKVKLLTGSYNTYDGGIITGHEKNNFAQTYFAGFRSTEGYRDNSDLKKGALSGKWFYLTKDGRGSAGIIARFFDMTADAPGYLPEEAAANDPTSSADYSRSDGGDQQNKHISFHFDYEFSNALAWTVKTYAQELERFRWSRWSDAGSQSEDRVHDRQYGGISTLTYQLNNIGIQSLKFDWGVDYQFNQSITQRWTCIDRVRQGDEIRYFDNDLSYWGSYIQADGTINDWLRLVAALRVDKFDGHFENKLTGTQSDLLDMGLIWQPKFGTTITPFKGYNIYANWGRTFQLPGVPARYGQGYDGSFNSYELSESENEGWDVGIKASPFDWLSMRANLWRMVATNEVRKMADGSGDQINAGETERNGWDLSFSVRPHPWFSLWGSYSRVEAIYTDPGPAKADRKGKDIELIPDYMAKLGISFDHPSGWSSSFWMESQGDYYVQNVSEDERRFGDYDIFNFKTSYKFQKLTKATVGLEVKNLFDKEYTAFVWSSDNGFQPGSGRSIYAWISYEF
ncbi:TonB-dependent receptor [uncultured Desulfobacter sp.]|uniref:TonB-dependent receptor n=1 Tax=uncultured Desulfobacter sp. TaxID=240139 RepID=UPI0029F45EF9|nr:TonB-dependent receptor [uncultured Desulfobacter sp.]